MKTYNEEEIDREFYRGKRLLDSGKLHEAIEIYEKLINFVDELRDNPGAILTLETSLNNRGVARCKLGLLKGDKELYIKGMDDFRKSISFTKKVEEQTWLTAASNLKYAENEIKNFSKLTDNPYDFFKTI